MSRSILLALITLFVGAGNLNGQAPSNAGPFAAIGANNIDVSGGEVIWSNPALLGIPDLVDEQATYPAADLLVGSGATDADWWRSLLPDGMSIDEGLAPAQGIGGARALLFGSKAGRFGLSVRTQSIRYGTLESTWEGSGGRYLGFAISQLGAGLATNPIAIGRHAFGLGGFSVHGSRLHSALSASELPLTSGPTLAEIGTSGSWGAHGDLGLALYWGSDLRIGTTTRNLVQHLPLSDRRASLVLINSADEVVTAPLFDFPMDQSDRDRVLSMQSSLAFPRLVATSTSLDHRYGTSSVTVQVPFASDGELGKFLEDEVRVSHRVDTEVGSFTGSLGRSLTEDYFLEVGRAQVSCSGLRAISVGIRFHSETILSVGYGHGFGGSVC